MRKSMPPSKASPSVLGAGFELIKQYGGEEQVRLKVVVEMPGSWFGSGAAGSLNAGERAEMYKAQATEFAAVHEFKKAGAKKATKEAGIRFLCMSDAAENANHPGLWIPLAQWNRYRHETYKDRRQDELQFIIAPADQATAQTKAPRAAELKPRTIGSTSSSSQVTRRDEDSRSQVTSSVHQAQRPGAARLGRR